MSRIAQPLAAAVWSLARCQHGVVARRQLLDLGMTSGMIKARVACGRLHSVIPGIYAVGRPGLDRFGSLMVSVLAAGPGAVLSHTSAGALYGFLAWDLAVIHISVDRRSRTQRSGIASHRRVLGPEQITRRHGVPITTPIETFLDLACMLSDDELERAIGDADRLGVIRADALQAQVNARPGRAGARRLRKLLDRHSFRLTHSKLEQKFLAIVRTTPLPLPDTQKRHGKYRVDFIWTGVGLVVETDGFTYHRTAAKQSEDSERDHFHLAQGRLPLRFSHAQIAYDRDYVEQTLIAVAVRLGA